MAACVLDKWLHQLCVSAGHVNVCSQTVNQNLRVSSCMSQTSTGECILGVYQHSQVYLAQPNTVPKLSNEHRDDLGE